MEDRRMSHEFPDVIIQHIQSFLYTKKAAQTMLVSKSWLRAWSTRPSLIFDWNLYVSSDVINRTLESYDEQGLSIVKFHLNNNTIEERWLEIIRQRNVIEISLFANYKLTDSSLQEIFLTESLKVLILKACDLSFKTTLNIKCRNLKKLEFRCVTIDEATFQHMMSSCPLIEDFLMAGPSMIDFMFESEYEYASLKRLSLLNAEINDEQLHTFLSKIPLLEDLSLYGRYKLVKPINLSSVTLKSVYLEWSNAQLVLYDAPNLRKIKYKNWSSETVPFPITVISPITKGTVKVTIDYCRVGDNIDESWILGMKELLAKIAKSDVEISLGYDAL